MPKFMSDSAENERRYNTGWQYITCYAGIWRLQIEKESYDSSSDKPECEYSVLISVIVMVIAIQDAGDYECDRCAN